MIRALAVSLVVLCAPRFVQAGTLFTNAVMVVTPTTLDFGRVATNTSATSTFLIENMGSAKLVGTATVAPPFKILSGGEYSLRENDAQIITVTYKPTGAASDTRTVYFTGGTGAKATVTGKPALFPPDNPKRR
jgi:hypothetical protein